ncbi:hypothetical protein JCM19296_3349 [Nonlabens ulvanivorans]|uniref:Uncharacterized protein n=1 Tax=Nonlabens ulvanivorans TaxID=906888 RepID=A0A081DFP4_NONUL|nr:hypothetical protein JCM19296_3349 [Nonlabens ulvanivorans]
MLYIVHLITLNNYKNVVVKGGSNLRPELLKSFKLSLKVI